MLQSKLATLNPAAISITLWVKAAYPDTGDGSYHIVLVDPNAKYQVYIYPNGDLDFGNYVDTNLAVDVGAWGDTWHYVAITQEEGTNNTKIYFDGALKKTGTVSRTGSTAGALYFGRREIASNFSMELSTRPASTTAHSQPRRYRRSMLPG